MSKYFFDGAITLYTPNGDGFERQLITSVKAEKTAYSHEERTEAVIFIPLYGKRYLTYLPEEKRPFPCDFTFTLKIGQRIVLGDHPEDLPPEDALDIEKLELFLSGSKRMRHARVTAVYKNNPIEKEDDAYEGADY